jgi:DNA-binding PadR family transcriptional regulator
MTLSALEALALDLLAATGPTYGLDLVASSRGKPKRGSVYVTLGRMEQKGFVLSPGLRVHARPASKLYPCRLMRSDPALRCSGD